MYREGNGLNYPLANLTELDAQLLELPHTDNNISMYILLPNEIGLQGKNLDS